MPTNRESRGPQGLRPARDKRLAVAAAMLVVSLTAGCSTNPVTGRDELWLLSESWELDIGREQYGPGQQMQGGRYVTDPEIGAYVRTVGKRLAVESDRPHLPYDFVVLNNSIPNAWALPGGKIALNRGLLVELGDEAELAAVLAHEIVHAAARHSANQAQRGMGLQILAVGIGSAASGSPYADLLAGTANVGAGLLMAKYGRGDELEADLYGIRYMARADYDPAGAVRVQESFVRLSEDKRQDWLIGLFASHPPSMERVEANRKTAAGLAGKGETARARYRERIGTLLRTKAAYEAHDEGRKALAEDNDQQALALAAKAIDVETREALFYALRADVYAKRGDYERASSGYERAIELNAEYFAFHVKEGLALEELGRLEAAKRALKRSIELLPTAVAYKALGDIALAQGDRGRALEYYRRASGSASQVGRQAAIALAELDLPGNPGAYLAGGLRLDRSGYLVAVVKNRSSVPVRNVAVQLFVTDQFGDWSSKRRLTLRGRLDPGQTATVRSGIGPFQNVKETAGYGVRVISAELVR